MEQVEIRKTIINVSELSSDLKKVNIMDGKLKYFLWKEKQDGSDTKAHAQFKNLMVQIGKVYEAEVEYEEKEFVNDKGKNIKFTSRKILYFYTDSKTPYSDTKSIPKAFTGSKSSLETRLDTASKLFQEMKNQLNALEVRISVLEAEMKTKI